MFIATLVAKERLSAGDISAACDAVRGTAGAVTDGRACDVRFAGDGKAGRLALETLFSRITERRWEGQPSAAEARFGEGAVPGFARTRPSSTLGAAETGVDVVVQVEAHRHRKLLIADMDSTMITVECIDELADYVGLKAEVSAVTEAAMRGEIDFAGALRSRVKLLAGLSEATVAECLRERVKIMGGAVDLIATFKAAGGRAVLVSGGFTHFTDSVAAQIGFDHAVANRLVVKDGVLTGEVEWPIVDAATKRDVLLSYVTGPSEPKSRHPGLDPGSPFLSGGAKEEAGPRPAGRGDGNDPIEGGLTIRQTLAIGDGANDIPMIEAAGLGIAYRAKPKTEAAAGARVRVGDLSVVRYALGLHPK